MVYHSWFIFLRIPDITVHHHTSVTQLTLSHGCHMHLHIYYLILIYWQWFIFFSLFLFSSILLPQNLFLSPHASLLPLGHATLLCSSIQFCVFSCLHTIPHEPFLISSPMLRSSLLFLHSIFPCHIWTVCLSILFTDLYSLPSSFTHWV